MGRETDLLRMLEPVTRPDGIHAPGRPRPNHAQPIESRSFASILEGANQAGANADGAAKVAADGPTSSVLSPLASIDHVENADLRRMLDPRR